MNCLILCVFGLLSLTAITEGRSMQKHSKVDLIRLKRHIANGIHLKRSLLDNRIDTFPAETFEDPSKEEEDQTVGEKLMEEFLTFLTLKESGFLDMCFQKK